MRSGLTLLALLATTMPAAASLLDVPHPGRIEARQLAARGSDALRRGENPTGADDLRRAVGLDPLLLPAWVNLSVAESRLCRPQAARAAALVALRLEPGRAQALAALRRSRELDCPSLDEETSSKSAWAALAPPGERPSRWEEAAAAFREQEEWLLAAFCTEQGMEGDDLPARRRIAKDLARASLLRAAVHAVGPTAPEATAWVRRLQQLQPRAEALAATVAIRTGEGSGSKSLEQILEVMLAAEGDEEVVLRRLLGLLGADRPRLVRTDWARLQLPPGWFTVESGAGDGGPLLVLRRAPGDAQIAFYGIEAEKGRYVSALATRFAGQAMSVRGDWQACGTEPDLLRCARADATIDLGPEGRGAIRLWRLSDPPGQGSLLALELPAEAGCGTACGRSIHDEAVAILTGVELGPEPPPAPGASAAILPVPACWRAPRLHREMADPWRNYALGDGLLIDLPPGLVVTTVGDHPLFEILPRQSRLWFRGEFKDREGRLVRVGDSEQAGWVSIDDPAPPELAVGEKARLIRRVPLDQTLAELELEGSGVALRIQQEGLDGEWLIIDRSFSGHVVRFAWPLTEGADSLSPLYAALTVRGDGPATLPPLVDLTSLYSVQFDRFPTRERRADPREGRLQAAELEFFVPRGFHVSLRSSSSDGFPLSLSRPESGSRITVSRWAGGASAEALQARAAQAEGGEPPEGWKRERARRGGVVLTAHWPAMRGKKPESPERFVVLLMPVDDPARASFRLRIERGGSSEEREWKSACSLLAGARYTRRVRR